MTIKKNLTDQGNIKVRNLIHDWQLQCNINLLYIV